MKREIKFRGKSTFNNQDWVYGHLALIDNVPSILEESMKWEDGAEMRLEEWSYVHENTIGQFTGLCDKNGNEIYEGDIVQMNIERGDILCVVTWNLEVGEWDLNLVGCMIEGVRPLGLWLRDSSCVIKVIGNKFDNPELLEE